MEHPDGKDFAHMKACEIMERLLRGEDVPCGANVSYRLVRGHLCYVYRRASDIPVPVEGFPNVLGSETPTLWDCVTAVKREAIPWLREHIARWRR